MFRGGDSPHLGPDDSACLYKDAEGKYSMDMERMTDNQTRINVTVANIIN